MSLSAARYLAEMSVAAVSKQSHVCLTFCLAYTSCMHSNIIQLFATVCRCSSVDSMDESSIENVEMVDVEDTQEIATTCHSMYPYS